MSQFDLVDDDGGTSAEDVDNSYEYDYELSDNVVEDLIEYSRSKIVKNEEQMLLGTLGYVSGFFDNPSHFISWVMIGTAGSGKSHSKNVIEELFPEEYLYRATSGSDKSLIYDDTWEDAYIAALDELQKPSDDLIEILKSLHGGEDEEFEYKVTSDGKGADRSVDTITRSAMPYSFLYAQYDPDFELWDRLLKIPIHESEEKNEGVLATQWDHKMISFGENEHEYMYDFNDGLLALKDHIEAIPKGETVKIPAGESRFGWDAKKHVKPIFDIKRSETNRVGGMVANLVRASCLFNHTNREKAEVLMDDEYVDAYIAEPQDVANVLACRDVLLATTHQLDRKKKALCLAIKERGGPKNAAPIKSIIEHLKETNASFVKRSQIEHMLQDLIDNHLVEKLERAGENGAHLYKFNGFHKLGTLNINSEFTDVFGDCTDPIKQMDFVESMREQNANLRPSMADFMSEGDVETDSDTADGQATLNADDHSHDLSDLQERVLERLYESLDGVVVDDLDEREPSIYEMLGMVELDSNDDIERDGTIFDPTHDVWLHEAGIETEEDTEDRIVEAMNELQSEGLWETDVTKARGNQPLAMRITVTDLS